LQRCHESWAPTFPFGGVTTGERFAAQHVRPDENKRNSRILLQRRQQFGGTTPPLGRHFELI